MTPFASRLPDFPDLLRATAEWKGVPADLVEKDYFLTRALHALEERCGGRFVLKGGTSLAKALPRHFVGAALCRPASERAQIRALGWRKSNREFVASCVARLSQVQLASLSR